MEARDAGDLGKERFERAKLGEDLHSRWLEEEAGANGLVGRRSLEERHPMPLPREQGGSRWTAAAASDDGDFERLHLGQRSLAAGFLLVVLVQQLLEGEVGQPRQRFHQLHESVDQYP